jgi:hypothetical protein
MKTSPTFTINGNEVNVTVSWPDKVGDFAISEARLLSLFTGFGTAHWVQSKIKAAYAAEKPSTEQEALLQAVSRGEELDGEMFIPKERGTARKDDAFVAEFRKRFDGFSAEKLETFAVRWNMEDASGDVDAFVTAYWAEKDRLVKEAAAAANALLD